LLPLTHDHHHVLAKARRLKLAAESGAEAELFMAAQEFVRFFETEGQLHFQEEEDELLPLFGEKLPQEALEMLEDHVVLRGLVRDLAHEANVASVEPSTALAVADGFARHVRFEEKVLFPLLESEASEAELEALSLAERDRPSTPS
jgi:hemerythrin-like domain-containing protein